MSEEWMRFRIAERDAEENKQRIIANGIDSLWQNLCAAIEGNLRAYEKVTPGEKIDWSGTQPAAVWARVGLRDPIANVSTKELNKLDVNLDRDRAEVTFRCTRPTGSGTRIRIGTNESGQACFLDSAGKPITVETAAEIILDPFLFPDQVVKTG